MTEQTSKCQVCGIENFLDDLFPVLEEEGVLIICWACVEESDNYVWTYLDEEDDDEIQ